MHKIILAFDAFKGSASSTEVAAAARKAIRPLLPACELKIFPIADGGEGTTDAICSCLQVSKVTCKVHDPFMNSITASYAITEDGNTAILEMAAASGLPLIATSQRNPMNTTTYGTGELIVDALTRGCRHFILGLGGSATNDAATGMLQALGVQFRDKNGNLLEPIGRSLQDIEEIDTTNLHPALSESTFTLACDVTNPFYGPQGAAYIYAPQKGANADEVALLDHGLRHYAACLFKKTGLDIASIPGSGAAGGMGGGLLPFLQATLKPGILAILDILHFDEALAGADLVLTGEGKLDAQTGMGKALSGILQKALQQQIPVIAIAGAVEDIPLLNQQGFTAVFSIQQEALPLERAIEKPITLRNVQATVSQIIRIIQQFNKI